MHRPSIYLAILAALLAPGCCLPQLSGRCERPAAGLTAQSAECALCTDGHAERHTGHGAHRGYGHNRGWLAGDSSEPTTPPGEVVPLPRFHPVPTHPVFEALPEYGLPRSLQWPAGSPKAETQREPQPTPAQPVPDPA